MIGAMEWLDIGCSDVSSSGVKPTEEERKTDDSATRDETGKSVAVE